jgi:PAS domain S-box-containing protein
VLPIKGRLARAIAIFVAAAIAGGSVYVYFAGRVAPVPQRALRIGFEPNPPFQIRADNGFSGLAVDIVNEAATRAGVRLQWVETGTSSEEAFRRGLVDLWPLMTDLPERHRLVHFSAPWVVGSHVLLFRDGAAIPEKNFAGRIAIFNLPLHVRLLNDEFPRAEAVTFADAREVLRQVCKGAVAAGFLEKRVAVIALKEMPPGCAIRFRSLPDLTLKTCVASTFEAAGAADLLRREIGNLYRDGSLAETVAKYSFYGLDDAWATYDLLQTSERGRWFAWGVGGFAVALTLAAWHTFSLRQRRRSENVLRASEEHFRAIFQQAGVGVAQMSLDDRVEIANDRYCEVVGYSRQDLVGRTTRDITYSEDLKVYIAMMPRLLKGEIESFTTEKRYMRQDGSIVWATMTRTVMRDGLGSPRCVIAVVEDITVRKQAEAALRESEERFRNLADSAPVLIWMCGPDKLCTFFNKGWLEFTGRRLEEELAGGWVAHVHPEDRERCLAAYASAFDARSDFQMEYRLRRADGEHRWVLSRGVARSYSGGTFAGYIGCSLDITDLKHSYEQHLATQKLESVGLLAAGVAHDFNNFLGAIAALAESAHADLAPDSPAARELDEIRLTALRAAQIASQLMTFTRQDNAPAVLIDLSRLIAEMLDLLKVSIAKAARLTTSLAPDLPPICANPSEIRQVVMNLVINASEALDGKPGSITVTTSRESPGAEPCSAVRLVVSDTGSGMTADTKARLFDPFFTTRFVGRGLGLSAVQGTIRRLGGSIEVESAPAEGSRFVVLLPCAADRPPADAGIRARNGAAAACRTVLFIEDEDSLRSPVAKLLRKRSFHVIEARDGAGGIASFNKSDPASVDVILLDVTLPGMSGREVFDELRRLRPDVRIILCTAYSRETAMAEFGEREIAGFIRKPYRTEDLVKVLVG